MTKEKKATGKPAAIISEEQRIELEAKFAKKKADTLAECFPLNPGGVSADVDPVPQPKRPAKVYPDNKLNPGGVRNPNN